MKTKLTKEAVRDAVLAAFLETDKPVRAEPLAERLGVSASTLRKFLGASGGWVPGTDGVKIDVPRSSKDYPGIQMGWTTAWAYQPTLSFMRERLLVERADHARAWKSAYVSTGGA